MNYRIRKARPTDLPTIYSFELAYIREIEPAEEESWKNAMHAHLAQWTVNLPRMFVATDGELMIGHCFWQTDGADAVLASLYVVPAARRQGLGMQLLLRFEQDAARRGWKHLTLSVHESNPAYSLYEHAGYQHAHSQDRYRHYGKSLEHSPPTNDRPAHNGYNKGHE